MIGCSDVITESSLRASISAGLRQLAKAVEQAQTATLPDADKPSLKSACEQVIYWLENQATTYDGRQLSLSWFRCLLADEMNNLRYVVGEQAFWANNYAEAGRLFNELASRRVN